VEVFRQHHDGIDGKRVFGAGLAKRCAEQGDVVGEHGRAPIRERQGEKVGPARDQIAAIPDHRRSLLWNHAVATVP
jgi:hypothetical protein